MPASKGYEPYIEQLQKDLAMRREAGHSSVTGTEKLIEESELDL